MQRPEGLSIVDADAEEVPAVAGLEELYTRYSPAGFRLAYLLTGDRRVAEDCVQDAFVKVIGRLGHLRTGVAFDAYLRRTIVNLVNNRWRRRTLERAHEASGRTQMHAIPSSDTALVERLAVWHAILGLPARQRTAIALCFYEDLAEADIAVIMRCRPGTIRSLISRGMASLRVELERTTDD